MFANYRDNTVHVIAEIMDSKVYDELRPKYGRAGIPELTAHLILNGDMPVTYVLNGTTKTITLREYADLFEKLNYAHLIIENERIVAIEDNQNPNAGI